MEKNYKEALDNICDLIKLAKQSPMAYKYLLYEVKVVILANSDEEPEFNQEDLSFHPNGKCGCIRLGDDYIFGIRCDHLMWMEGNCEGVESFWGKDDDLDLKADDPLRTGYFSIIISGNHKGKFIQKLIVFHKKANK